MDFYINQEVFSFKDKFYIKNAEGEDLYYVEGKFWSIGKKLRIYDMEGDEAAYLEQEVWTLLPKFEVQIDGETVAVIQKKLSLFTPKFEVEGPDWTVEGDFFAHDYTIMKGDEEIADISKEWLAWGDTYEISVNDPDNDILALSVVLAIDAVLEMESNAAAASISVSSSNNNN